jgi:hypothetical protein
MFPRFTKTKNSMAGSTKGRKLALKLHLLPASMLSLIGSGSRIDGLLIR